MGSFCCWDFLLYVSRYLWILSFRHGGKAIWPVFALGVFEVSKCIMGGRVLSDDTENPQWLKSWRDVLRVMLLQLHGPGDDEA